MCDNTSFDDRIKETQDKNGIFDQKKRKPLTIFVIKLTNARRPGNRSSGSYAEVMRICRMRINRYEKWL